MKKVTKTSVLIIIITIVFLSTFSCGQKTGNTVSQKEYDAIKAQLSAAEAKIAQLEAAPALTVTVPEDPTLEAQIDSLNAEITELGAQISALNGQNDSLKTEKASLEARYTELNAKYQELQQTLADLTRPKIITEEQVEDEIFKLINQERVAAGVLELELGQYLYQQARQNTREMESLRKFVYNPAVFYQENFWAAGYDSVEAIAHGALLTWKANQYNFEHGALLPGNKYGAVGAYKSGEIIYITFMAAPFK